WYPDPALLAGGVQPRSAASFTAHFSPDAILARARAWIGRPGTAFARFLDEDLRSYLDDGNRDPRETHQRRAAYRGALPPAVSAAEPLVRLAPALMGLLHHQAAMPQRAVPSALPFLGHPVEQQTREILAAALGVC